MKTGVLYMIMPNWQCGMAPVAFQQSDLGNEYLGLVDVVFKGVKRTNIRTYPRFKLDL